MPKLLSWLWDSIKRPGGVPEDRKKLRKHIFSTYWWLRLGMVLIAAPFPAVLVIVGWYYGVEWQDSMSAYYWAVPEMGGDAPMRVWFVGPLFALGTLLFLYKGYTWLENVLLDVAAVCAICVALIPMCWGPECPSMCLGLGLTECPRGSWSWLHNRVAIGFFGAVALVAILHGAYSGGKLWSRPEKGEENRDLRYAVLYVVLAVAMPLAPWLVWRIYNPFWGKVVGIGAFCGFWLVQLRQIRTSNIDQEPAS